MNKVRVLYLRNARALYGQGLCYATEQAAGMDLRACPAPDQEGWRADDDGQLGLVIPPGGRAGIPAGIAVEPMVSDVAGFVYSRSGLGAVKGLTVAQGVGVIDADYRGEIVVWLLNTSSAPRIVRPGDRVAQLVFHPLARLEPEEAQSLTDTRRGAGGFGHTGQS